MGPLGVASNDLALVVVDSRSVGTIEGFRWPVTVEQGIAASSQDVWAAISTPGVLERCHPFCSANPVDVWPGAGSRDEVHYYNGLVYERRFLEWREGAGYSLQIGEPNGPSSLVTWEVSATGSSASTLAITVYPHILQGVPVVARWVPHLGYVRPLLRRYLRSVVSGFGWYVTRHEPVRRNQFGTHPWFSPTD